jgi:hypothetical protein
MGLKYKLKMKSCFSVLSEVWVTHLLEVKQELKPVQNIVYIKEL